MECRPPLPICAEGGGGTQLLGCRGHSPAPKVWPTLPGRAASLSFTSSPRCLWREKGEAVGRGGERGKGRGGLVETAEVGLMGHLSHSNPAGHERPKGKEPLPSQPRACPPPPSAPTGAHHHPDPKGQQCTHPLMHTSHPTHSPQTHPPQVCMQPVHPRHTRSSPVPRAQPLSPHHNMVCKHTCTHTPQDTRMHIHVTHSLQSRNTPGPHVATVHSPPPPPSAI